jgi:ring-1,2-phenylacetyl-CoA epoxidase subunit PaaD
VVETRVDPWSVLRGIPDPEIPVLSIVELGIVREARAEGDRVEVAITPTYSGCPAMHAIEEEIAMQLRGAGYRDVQVKRVLAPAWSTDWIAPEARERLRGFGVAPPQRVHVVPRRVECPRCGSRDTERVSQFGSTACKAQYRCVSCLEPFDYFKPL